MKSPLRRIAKVIVAMSAAAVAFLILVINFGTVESRLECPGDIASTATGKKEVKATATLYARVEAYRWIVFWVDHDAMIFWEIQPGSETGFGYYSDSSFAAPITDLARTKQYGSWSSLSKRIYVETSPLTDEAFEGICK
jgi:hypothetical protein